MRTRIYLAGPITVGDLNANINQAREAARKLIRAGFSVFIPQLSCYLDGDSPKAEVEGITHAQWLSQAEAWVAVSHALLRLPGESKGADYEVRWAYSHRVPVFYSLDDVLKAFSD